MWCLKDSDRSKTDLLAQIDEVMNFIRKYINKEVIITGNAQNTPRWLYPMEAIREIVMNMIIHRDYRSASDSIVKIHDNKIEFFNPGRLPDHITVEDLLSNNYSSEPRNKLIADFCKDLGLIEKYGSGIRRVLELIHISGLPQPEFRNLSGGFRVTLFSGVEKIINAIHLNPFITQRELVELTGLTRRGIEQNMRSLRDKGIIRRIGPDKGGHWEIIKYH